MGKREKNSAAGFALRKTNQNEGCCLSLLPLVALATRLHDYVWLSPQAPKQARWCKKIPWIKKN